MPFKDTSSKFSYSEAPESGQSFVTYCFTSLVRSTSLNSSSSFFICYFCLLPLSLAISSSFYTNIYLALVFIISLSDCITAYQLVKAQSFEASSEFCSSRRDSYSAFSYNCSCTLSLISSSIKRAYISFFVGDSCSTDSLILLLSSSFSSISCKFLFVNYDNSRSS